jgi:hypothetical protein
MLPQPLLLLAPGMLGPQAPPAWGPYSLARAVLPVRHAAAVARSGAAGPLPTGLPAAPITCEDSCGAQ